VLHVIDHDAARAAMRGAPGLPGTGLSGKAADLDPGSSSVGARSRRAGAGGGAVFGPFHPVTHVLQTIMATPLGPQSCVAVLRVVRASGRVYGACRFSRRSSRSFMTMAARSSRVLTSAVSSLRGSRSRTQRVPRLKPSRVRSGMPA